MRSKKKVLMLVLCGVLLVGASILGTMAYLTSQDQVNNTFTVGDVAITLDESKVNANGEKEGQTRVKQNTYHLMPGHSYTKDPIVHITAGSDKSFVFVKLENGLKDIVADKTIEAQIIANGWEQLKDKQNKDVPGVYYRSVEKSATATDLTVFESFKVKDDVGNTTLKNYANAKITVTAYAVQADGFDNAADAWSSTFGE